MKNNKLISVSVIMFTFFFFAEAEEVSINFDGNYEKIKMEKNIEINTQAVKPQSDGKIEILQKKTLGELLNKCSTENKIEFYKSLVFIRGKLASMSVESLEGCLSNNDMDFLVKMLRENDDENSIKVHYKCICNIYQYFVCKQKFGFTCNRDICIGKCLAKANKEDNSLILIEGYINVNDIIMNVPEKVAENFIDSFIIDNGMVSGYYYGEILKYLGPNKTKELLENLI
jgi:hypothetical protein